MIVTLRALLAGGQKRMPTSFGSLMSSSTTLPTYWMSRLMDSSPFTRHTSGSCSEV